MLFHLYLGGKVQSRFCVCYIEIELLDILRVYYFIKLSGINISFLTSNLGLGDTQLPPHLEVNQVNIVAYNYYFLHCLVSCIPYNFTMLQFPQN